MARRRTLLRQKSTTRFSRTKGPFCPAVRGFFTRLPEFGHELASLLTRTCHLLDA
jgi:hypothetical protein